MSRTSASLVALVVDPESGKLRYARPDLTTLSLIEDHLLPAQRRQVEEACRALPANTNEWLATLLIVAFERRDELAGLVGDMHDAALDWYVGALVAERIKGKRDVQRSRKSTN